MKRAFSNDSVGLSLGTVGSRPRDCGLVTRGAGSPPEHCLVAHKQGTEPLITICTSALLLVYMTYLH